MWKATRLKWRVAITSKKNGFMKNQVTQLSFDFECVQEQFSLTQKEVKRETKTVRYSISRAEFEAQMELEKDLMYGRGAWLYAQFGARAGA